MSSRRYDTLATARDLESTGLERPQAEAIAQAIGSHGERLATGDDIERLEARAASKEDIARLEAQSATKDDVARLEARSASKEDVQRHEAATREEFAGLDAKFATKAELYRALWIHGGGIVAIMAALKFLP